MKLGGRGCEAWWQGKGGGGVREAGEQHSACTVFLSPIALLQWVWLAESKSLPLLTLLGRKIREYSHHNII